MMPASRDARQVQRLSMSTGPLMTRPARYEAEPSCTTPCALGNSARSERSRTSPISRELPGPRMPTAAPPWARRSHPPPLHEEIEIWRLRIGGPSGPNLPRIRDGADHANGLPAGEHERGLRRFLWGCPDGPPSPPPTQGAPLPD